MIGNSIRGDYINIRTPIFVRKFVVVCNDTSFDHGIEYKKPLSTSQLIDIMIQLGSYMVSICTDRNSWAKREIERE